VTWGYGDFGWEALRAEASYRVFIRIYRIVGLIILSAGVIMVAVPAWAGPAVLAMLIDVLIGVPGLLILLAISLRRAGLPVWRGLTSRRVAMVVNGDLLTPL
jgi:hypothetical protein